MLETGLMVTIIGMGMVFFFLSIMVCSMFVMEYILKIVNKYFPEPVNTALVPVSANNDVEIAIAIAAAKRK